MHDLPKLKFTGERFTPECVREMSYEHWHRYAWASTVVNRKKVLDAACGEGYGSYLLSAAADQVIGVDLSPDAIRHANDRYSARNLKFHQGDVTRLQLRDASIDTIVSFETLEHLEAQDDMLREFRRVLRPDGYLLISSPNKKTYSDDTGYQNPYHAKELYRREFQALLNRYFPAHRLYGQKLMFVSTLWEIDTGGEAIFHNGSEGQVNHDTQPALAPLYFLAIAAVNQEALPVIPSISLYSDREESVYQHYNEEIRKHIRAGHLLAERDAEIAQL